MAKMRERFLSESEKQMLNGITRKLYLIRLITNRTQEDMAKILNVTRGHISGLENGLSYVSVKLIIRASMFFSIPIDDFVFMTEEDFFNKYVEGV